MKSHGFFSAQSHLPGRSEGMFARGSDAADIRLVLSRGRGYGGGLRGQGGEGAGGGRCLAFHSFLGLHKRFNVTVVEATLGVFGRCYFQSEAPLSFFLVRGFQQVLKSLRQ